MEGVYYKHSGKYSAGALAVGSVIATVVACITGFLYSYLILYIPIAGYISFLFSAGFGGIVGYATAKLLKAQKVRNSGMAALATLIVTTIAFYFSWAVWVNAFLARVDIDSSLGLVLSSPLVLLGWILEINANGAWTIRNWTPTGGALWAIWGLEALLIYGLALVLGYGEMESEPFCENCQVWCPKTEGVVNVKAAENAEDFKRHLEMRDVKFLEQLGPMAQDAMEWEQIDLHSCPKCNSTNTLSVKHVTVKMEKNEAKQETSDTVDKIVLTLTDADAIRRLGEKWTAAAPAAGAATAGS